MVAVSEIRASEIIEKIIRSYLERGEVPTFDEIETEFNSYIALNDLDLPRFNSTDYNVAFKGNSSASLYNNTNATIKEDLNTLFTALLNTTDQAVKLFNRWETKAQALEHRILGLEGRIGRLLAVAEDTEGYFDVVGDTFNNLDLTDLDLSDSIDINLNQNLITMSKSTGTSSAVSRVFLNSLTSNQVTFNLLQQNGVQLVTPVDNTEPRFAFYDSNTYWKTNAYLANKVSVLAGDLTLSLVEPISISKISIKLHSSQSNSATTVTPMYSTDGVNYQKLPISNTSLQSIDKVEFIFPEISVLKLKLILEKNGHDFISSDLNYVYEFGAKEIALYKEAFSDDPNFTGLFISKPLSAQNTNGDYSLFNKLTLKVCELTSSTTSINYYIAVGKELDGVPRWLTSTGFVTSPDHLVGGEDTRLWTAISPLNREEIIYPQVLDFGTLTSLTREDIGISYDMAGGTYHESPKQTFTLMTKDISDTLVYENCETTTGEYRYVFNKTSQKLLDLQISKDINVDINNVILWRNIGEKGIAIGDTTKKVRGIQIGWEFSEPYYSTTIYIGQTEGMVIDTGNLPITIDEVNYTGVVSSDILSRGTHSIKIHKDYWRAVPPELNTIQELKQYDILYPYNQKLLIEGYEYGASYPEADEKIYSGVDRFAGSIMQKVSIFDMINNVKDNDYTKFSVDTDIPGVSEIVGDAAVEPSYVFLLNTNNAIADFMNEKFMLEFNLTDELFSFLALRAELKTQNSEISPVFEEYQIKLSV
jgi:hypothetical protein